jgi:hypothetical protein
MLISSISKSIMRNHLRPVLPGTLALLLIIPQPDIYASFQREGRTTTADRSVSAQSKNEKNKVLADLLRSAGFQIEGVPSPSPVQRAQEILVRWEPQDAAALRTASAAEQTTAPGRFSASGRRVSAGNLPKQRSFDISPGQLLVIGLDEREQLRSWTLIPDHRILRAEAPGPTGELRGQIIYRSSAEFLVLLPDDPSINVLRIYLPRRTNDGLNLVLLGSLPLERR